MNTPRRTATRFFALLVAAGVVVPAHAARDPMRPPQAGAARGAVRVEPAPALTAVMGAGERRVAIVNGRVVRAGDTVDGALIVAVFEGGIRYSRAGAMRELRLPTGPAVKRPARDVSAGPGSGR